MDLENIRAKKRWGQHFLIDPNIARKILDCAQIQAGETILEIGPGRGFLTKGLLRKEAKVIAIEIDSDLVNTFKSEIESSYNPEDTNKLSNLTLIQGDALRYPYPKIPSPYKVVANLPYYISTPLIFRLLEEKQRIPQMVLMLQKEVAQRIVASVGDKSYGALSIILQYYTDVNIAFLVSPNCFKPKPKVASAVITISFLQVPRIRLRDEALFLKVVKGAFLYRRKRLANALICAGFSEEEVKISLKNIDCDPARRGETLTMSEFARLSETMFDYRKRL